jgi:ATP-dependent helicase IRC3
MIEVNWRPYQVECKKAIKENYDKGITKQLIVAATGVGKRMMAVDLMQHFQRSLFIVHREELMQQAYDEIEKYYPMNVGIVKQKTFEIDKKIVVASVQTLANRLDKIDPNSFQLIICDEVHHYMARSYCNVARHWNAKLFTGWTATPRRLDGLSLSNLFDKIVFEYDIADGIKDGFLAPIEAYQIKSPTDISRVKRTAGDFNQKQLSEAVDNELRNNLIVQKYKKYTPNRQAIAYCVDIDHAYHLRDEFRKNGIISEAVSSDKDRCDNRSELIRGFRDGSITVLTNCEILTEGFDYSDIGTIMMCRPTQSETLYKQCLGRGSRLK